MFCVRSLVLIFMVFLASSVWGQSGDEEFNPKTVIPRAFPAIKDVANYAGNDEKVTLDDDELVLGVEINGESRAYPINMLKGPLREIINDRLGDTDIAATW